jgi:hypothetical protein
VAARYLPDAPPDSSWRFSGPAPGDLPAQGWKLHVSATIVTAPRVLATVGPRLRRRAACFKGPATLAVLDRLNTGLDGFSQVGKFLTVYCRDEGEAVTLAGELHEATLGIAHPEVPYDQPFKSGGAVYYRYGAFGDQKISRRDGSVVGAIRGPRGRLVPDRREPGRAVPDWIMDPLASSPEPLVDAAWSPLALDYRAFQVLQRRGKGSVYLAVDVTRVPAGLCVVKEGLRHGETDALGRDGYWRVRREGRILRSLARAGVPVPAVIAEFDAAGNRYLVLEHIEGMTLGAVLAGESIDGARARAISRALRRLVRDINAAGWSWRDLKPENIVIGTDQRLRPLDFEGACRVGSPTEVAWGTPGYVSRRRPRTGPNREPDIFALGVLRRQLLAPARRRD